MHNKEERKRVKINIEMQDTQSQHRIKEIRERTEED